MQWEFSIESTDGFLTAESDGAALDAALTRNRRLHDADCELFLAARGGASVIITLSGEDYDATLVAAADLLVQELRTEGIDFPVAWDRLAFQRRLGDQSPSDGSARRRRGGPGWFWRRRREPRLVCDVCFNDVESDADMCPHCGTVFGNPDREDHEVVPEQWVAGQLKTLRAMSYAELQTLPALSRTFTFSAEDGSFRGEVCVSFDDGDARTGDVSVSATIRAAGADAPLATGDFTRQPG